MRRPFLGIFYNELTFEEETKILMKLLFANGVDAVCFTASDVHSDSDTVNAKVLKDGEFTEEKVYLPRLLECGSLSHKNRQKLSTICEIIDDFRLSKKDVNDLLLTTSFAPCVIPTRHTAKPQNILSLTALWKEIIIKPLVGARGEGICTLRSLPEGQFEMTDTKGKTEILDFNDALLRLENMYNNLTVIVQPRMKFLNSDGKIMDYRINVEKNGEGEWETVFMIARTSRDSIVSNFSAGGYASLLDVTLSKEYKDDALRVKEALERIASEVPMIIEKASECNMLSLGIDVGVDRDTLQAYIIEVNYVPQVHYFKSEYLYKKAEYFSYLYRKHKA